MVPVDLPPAAPSPGPDVVIGRVVGDGERPRRRLANVFLMMAIGCKQMVKKKEQDNQVDERNERIKERLRMRRLETCF